MRHRGVPRELGRRWFIFQRVMIEHPNREATMKLIVALSALVLSASTALAGGYYGSTGVYYDDPDIYDPVPSVVVTRRVVYAPPPPPVYHVRRTVYVGGPPPVPYYGHYGRGYYGGGFYGVKERRRPPKAGLRTAAAIPWASSQPEGEGQTISGRGR